MSRDILNYPHDNTQIALVDYYARCSIASLGTEPIGMPSAVQRIGSKFQRRMVERDIRKEFLSDLSRLQFDILLLDLIDERFNLYLEPEGRACTLSGELLCSGFLKDVDRGLTITSGSEEFWRLWEAGWLILLNKLKGLNVLDRLRVNQVFWSSRTESGGNFEPDYSDRQIALANQSLERMYRHISADIPSQQFLRFDYGLMTGSISHKWGTSPFHYVDAYYHAAIQQLCAESSLKKAIATSTETVTREGLNNSRLRLVAAQNIGNLADRCSELSINQTFPSCAKYSIDKVVLDHERDELVATAIFEAPETGQFSFYVFRNGERIHTQGYSPNPTLRVGIKSEPGLYRVLVFFLSTNGIRIAKYSNSVFLYPVPATLGHV